MGEMRLPTSLFCAIIILPLLRRCHWEFRALFFFISHAKMQPEPQHIERTILVRKRAQNKHTMKKSALRRMKRKWREKEERKNRTFIVAHFAWSVVFFVLFDIITTNDGEQHDDVMRHCRRLESSMKPGSVWKSIKLLNLKDIGVSSPLSSWHCTIHFNSFHTHESLLLHALKGWQKLCDFLTLKDAINNPFSLCSCSLFLRGFNGPLTKVVKAFGLVVCAAWERRRLFLMKNYQQMLAHFTILSHSVVCACSSRP